MSALFPRTAQLRPKSLPSTITYTQVRTAVKIRRPLRPYTFTNLTVLSDGSTYLARTTSPQPVVVSSRDTRNHPLWNPAESKFRNLEEDEAGRLRRFRERFGAGFDTNTVDADGKPEENLDSILDIIEGAGSPKEATKEVKKEVEKKKK